LLGRNFANKLWNAARLILEGGVMVRQAHHDQGNQPVSLNPRNLTLADRWILSRLQGVTRDVTGALGAYRFNETARLLYQFVWHDLCDWYLEIAKLQRESNDAAVARDTEWILRTALERTLRLLHPVMPFITEELWRKVQASRHCEDSERREGTEAISILRAPWPEADAAWTDAQAEERFAQLQAVVVELRNIRATFRVPPKERMQALVQGGSGLDLLTRHEEIIRRLAGVEKLAHGAKVQRPAGSVVSHLPARGGCDAWDVIVPLAGLVDLAVERKRMEKRKSELESFIRGKKARLQDSSFRAKAPAEVVAEEEESLKELEAELARWAESLRQLE